MRVLFLPNWPVYADPAGRQPADYRVPGEPYWFFRHFEGPVQVRVIDVARWPGWRLEDRYLRFYGAQGLAAALARRRPDVVLAHGAQSAVALLSLARGLRVSLPPVVVIDVGAFNHGRPEQRSTFAPVRWALGAAARVVWHSSASRAMAERYAPEIAARGEVVPLGVELPLWPPLPAESSVPGLAGDPPHALSVGYAKRDYDLLGRAWHRLPDVPLRVLGATQEAAPGLVATFSPRVPFAAYQDRLRAAALVVHVVPDGPASQGQMTLLDAFAAARPVVVTDVAPVRDYLGPWCVPVPPDDPGGLAGAVRRLWEDPGERERLGAAARRAAEERFDARDMARRIEAILRECVARAGERPGRRRRATRR